MRIAMIQTGLGAALAMFTLVTPARAVTYTVGNDPGGPTTIVEVDSGPFGSQPSFSFSSGIDYDGSAGNLLKDFTNTSQGSGGPASGIPSGHNVPITETFSNDGSETWTAWTEQVVSQTDFSGPMGPGFLFDTSVTVKRNGLTLIEGVNYTLSGSMYNQFGNSGYDALTITFAPGFTIQPTDSLEIDKQIHEVFGDGNTWTLDEAARVAEYPTAVPEPAATGMAALGLIGVIRRRRKARAR